MVAKTRKMPRGTAADPILSFKTQKHFATWLEKNHSKSSGIWVRIAKKGSGETTVSYAEGLETALCYGWIDAHKFPESEKAWLQRFTPRRRRSIWSKINREKAINLVASGRMRPPGLAEIERAKGDGRWESAYDSPRNVAIPPEFQAELDRNPRAKAAFETLDRINRYAMIWRIHVAKRAETRDRHVRRFIDMLEKGERLH